MTTTNKLTTPVVEATDEHDNKLFWEAKCHIASFALPLVKSLRSAANGYPQGLSEGEWDMILSKIIYSLDSVSKDRTIYKAEEAALQEGLDLFGEWFQALWD